MEQFGDLVLVDPEVLCGVLRRWADHLDVACVEDRPTSTGQEPIWDGDTLWTADLDTPEDWAHELAHWAVAGDERRHLANYGLGPDWMDGYAATDPSVRIDHEETSAAVLGVCWLRLIGGDPHRNAEANCWVQDGDRWVPGWDHHLDLVQPWVDRFDRWATATDVKSRA